MSAAAAKPHRPAVDSLYPALPSPRPPPKAAPKSIPKAAPRTNAAAAAVAAVRARANAPAPPPQRRPAVVLAEPPEEMRAILPAPRSQKKSRMPEVDKTRFFCGAVALAPPGAKRGRKTLGQIPPSHEPPALFELEFRVTRKEAVVEPVSDGDEEGGAAFDDALSDAVSAGGYDDGDDEDEYGNDDGRGGRTGSLGGRFRMPSLPVTLASRAPVVRAVRTLDHPDRLRHHRRRRMMTDGRPEAPVVEDGAATSSSWSDAFVPKHGFQLHTTKYLVDWGRCVEMQKTAIVVRVGRGPGSLATEEKIRAREARDRAFDRIQEERDRALKAGDVETVRRLEWQAIQEWQAAASSSPSPAPSSSSSASSASRAHGSHVPAWYNSRFPAVLARDWTINHVAPSEAESRAQDDELRQRLLARARDWDYMDGLLWAFAPESPEELHAAEVPPRAAPGLSRCSTRYYATRDVLRWTMALHYRRLLRTGEDPETLELLRGALAGRRDRKRRRDPKADPGDEPEYAVVLETVDGETRLRLVPKAEAAPSSSSSSPSSARGNHKRRREKQPAAEGDAEDPGTPSRRSSSPSETSSTTATTVSPSEIPGLDAQLAREALVFEKMVPVLYPGALLYNCSPSHGSYVISKTFRVCKTWLEAAPSPHCVMPDRYLDNARPEGRPGGAAPVASSSPPSSSPASTVHARGAIRGNDDDDATPPPSSEPIQETLAETSTTTTTTTRAAAAPAQRPLKRPRMVFTRGAGAASAPLAGTTTTPRSATSVPPRGGLSIPALEPGDASDSDHDSDAESEGGDPPALNRFRPYPRVNDR